MGVVPPLLAMAVALFEGVAWQYFVEDREKRRVMRLFGRYVSKDVFDHLMANPGVARLGGERRDMTVLFSDIAASRRPRSAERPKRSCAAERVFHRDGRRLFRHQGTSTSSSATW